VSLHIHRHMESADHMTVGPAEQVLDRGYLHYCDDALDDFCALFLPCTFKNRRGKCVNVREGHTKGHQNAKGTIIGTGVYESDFTWESFETEWLDLLQDHLSHFQSKIQEQSAYNQNATLLVLASTLHHHNINTFFQRVGGARLFISHSACLCCLREMAEHPLPCGHVLCSPCIKAYGHPNHNVYSISACPLHETSAIFADTWKVAFKPPLAGVRILSLDG